MYTAKNQLAINSVLPRDQSILDIGCGTGSTAKEIKKRSPKIRIVGVNFCEKELKLANQFLDLGIKADLNNPQELHIEEKFDLIICSHVLEHLIDPKKLIEHLKGNLSAHGRMILIVPNFGIWNARFRILMGRFRYEDHGLYDRTHLRFFTFYTFADEVVPDSMQLVSHHEGGHFPLPIIRKWMPARLLDILDRFAIKLFPNIFSYEIALVIKGR